MSEDSYNCDHCGPYTEHNCSMCGHIELVKNIQKKYEDIPQAAHVICTICMRHLRDDLNLLRKKCARLAEELTETYEDLDREREIKK